MHRKFYSNRRFPKLPCYLKEWYFGHVLNNTSFTILSASAGTGKTYRLTKAYLKRLLAAPSFVGTRQLLALTFTNKAVAEMKERILDNLYGFCQDRIPEKNQSLFNTLADELALGHETLKLRASRALKGILHNYAFFDILTIDAFNHRLIRTFAKDLKLNQNFEVELDTNYLMGLAVDKLLDKVGRDAALSKILVEFALEKIDANRSWNIGHDLFEIGKLLFNETHFEQFNTIKKVRIERFFSLKKTLFQQLETLDGQITQTALIALDEIAKQGFEPTDFVRGTIPNHFKKIRDGERGKALYANKIEENLASNTTVVKKAVGKGTTLLSARLHAHYTLLKQLVNQHQFLVVCQKKIVPLALVTELANQLENIKHERNSIPIIEFNKLIFNEIKKQPVPFIYERLGERYRHYFIDEFQDTSKMQWGNLIPLIGNSLEASDPYGNSGSLFLVGDVKQAIYRWRGGEAQQFLDLVLEHRPPFTIKPRLEQLDKNWRSYDAIVQFNNAFFTHCATKLDRNEYQKMYWEGNKQKSNHKTGGMVTISFVESGVDPSGIHSHCVKALGAIHQITAKGHPLGTICLLVRKNNEGVLLADFLTAHAIPVVSQEALLLKNNTEVTFLVDFLNFLDAPDEKSYRFLLLEYLAKDPRTVHGFIRENLQEIHHFLKKDYGLNSTVVQLLGPFEALKTVIRHFNLVPTSNNYINSLLEFAFAYEAKLGKSIAGFLAHWELKKDRLAIAAQHNANAVQVMTIHKSKGLEFPFVIFPFADTPINDTKKKKDIWFKTQPEDFEGFGSFMAPLNEHMPHYSKDAAKAYLKEIQKGQLDDMNVLYVALTRAIYGLYIITSPPRKNPTTPSYSSLFWEFAANHQTFEHQEVDYTIGMIESGIFFSAQEKPTETIPYIYSTTNQLQLPVLPTPKWGKHAKESIAFGNLLHQTMAMIDYATDTEIAIKKIQEKNTFKKGELKKLKTIVHQIVNHPQLKKYFADGYMVYNEKELLTKAGKVLRPDRMMIKKNKVSLIDYKTGRPSDFNREQLTEYARVMEDMGFEPEERLLVYSADDNITLVPI